MCPEEKQCCVAWQRLGGGHYSFFLPCRVSPLTREGKAATGGGEAASSGKDDSSEFGGSTTLASSGSSYVSPSQVMGSHFFSTNAFTVTVDALGG